MVYPRVKPEEFIDITSSVAERSERGDKDKVWGGFGVVRKSLRFGREDIPLLTSPLK